MDKPYPGSGDAVKAGCACPVFDNCHGAGCGYVDDDGEPTFWITDHCPIHGLMEEDDE